MGIKAGIIGVGPVGQNIYNCIQELGLDCDEIRIMATRERTEIIDGKEIKVEELGVEYSEDKLKLFEGLDVVFFAGREGEKGAAKTWAKAIIDKYGVYCIDNGADFRMDEGIPLIVPEVNMDAATADTKFIASPNCSTIQLCVALAPLHKAAKLRRVIVSTYQSVSGWGREAQTEMHKLLSMYDPATPLKPLEFDPAIFRRPIVLDCLPHIDSFMDNGYTKEELKMHFETRKIFGDEGISVNATTVRVPVEVGHSEAVTAEFEGKMDAKTAVELWRKNAGKLGLMVIDDLAKDTPGWPKPSAPKNDIYSGIAYAEERSYPTQADILKDEYKNKVLVGRTRNDISRENSIDFWCVADNLRKGAATNVVQIAIGLVEQGLIG